MARPKDGSGGGRGVTKDFFYDFAEVALGAIFGSMTSVGVRELLQGVFTGKGDADDLPVELRKEAREIVKLKAKNAGADKALIELADNHMANIISIRMAGKSPAEEAKAIADATKDYKLAVAEYKNSQFKKDLPGIMEQLGDLDKKIAAGGEGAPSRPSVIIDSSEDGGAGRPKSYVRDFMQWQSTELSPAQRTMLLSRRGKIKSARMIMDTLDFTANPNERFDYLIFAMGEIKPMELGVEVVKTALNGSLEDHPIAKRISSWSETSAASAQDRREMQGRCFSNRRKV